MSLINQALKKAQRERNAPPAPESVVTPRRPGELRPTHAETQKSYQVLTWMVGGGILITGVGAAIALAIVLIQPKPVAPAKAPDESVAVKISLPRPMEESGITSTVPGGQSTSEQEPVPLEDDRRYQETPPAPESIVKTAPVPEPPSPVAATPVQAPPPVAQVQPTPAPTTMPVEGDGHYPKTDPAPEPEPVAEVPPEASAIQDQPVAVAGDLATPEPPPAPDAPLPGAEPNPKVLAFLQSSRITGIKVAGVHSRLLMNNQVFRMNDLVQPETQLRIKEIAANEILFVDESGIQYRKQFRR